MQKKSKKLQTKRKRGAFAPRFCIMIQHSQKLLRIRKEPAISSTAAKRMIRRQFFSECRQPSCTGREKQQENAQQRLHHIGQQPAADDKLIDQIGHKEEDAPISENLPEIPFADCCVKVMHAKSPFPGMGMTASYIFILAWHGGGRKGAADEFLFFPCAHDVLRL